MSEYLCLNKLGWIDSSDLKKVSASPAVAFLFSSPDAPRKERFKHLKASGMCFAALKSSRQTMRLLGRLILAEERDKKLVAVC